MGQFDKVDNLSNQSTCQVPPVNKLEMEGNSKVLGSVARLHDDIANPPPYGCTPMPLHPAHFFRLDTGHVSQSSTILVCKSINIQQPFLELPSVYSQRLINGMP